MKNSREQQKPFNSLFYAVQVIPKFEMLWKIKEKSLRFHFVSVSLWSPPYRIKAKDSVMHTKLNHFCSSLSTTSDFPVGGLFSLVIKMIFTKFELLIPIAFPSSLCPLWGPVCSLIRSDEVHVVVEQRFSDLSLTYWLCHKHDYEVMSHRRVLLPGSAQLMQCPKVWLPHGQVS